VPTYEYECNDCGHCFEEFQRITDPPLEECPKCGGTIRRLPGPGAAVLFRGSGFYATDYRSDEYKRKAKEEKEPPKKDEAKTSPKEPSSEPSDS
jgi:putative FmdB family regulatory protein